MLTLGAESGVSLAIGREGTARGGTSCPNAWRLVQVNVTLSSVQPETAERGSRTLERQRRKPPSTTALTASQSSVISMAEMLPDQRSWKRARLPRRSAEMRRVRSSLVL